MEPLEPGLLRVAVACVVALLLGGPSASPGAWLPYLAVGLAAAYGVLLASGRSGTILGNGLAGLLIDASLVTVLVASTGGQGSPFFPLYLLAALGVCRTPGIAPGVAGTAAVSGGYLVAILLADGPAALLSDEAGRRVGLIALFCAVSASVGARLRGAREHGRTLSSTLDAERSYGERVAALVPRFGSVLEVVSLEGVLRRAAEAARGSLGVPYAHAATREGEHGTSAGGDLDAYPTWWHPVIQGLVLHSCRAGEVARDGGVVHGVGGFVAVPVISADGARLGAVVVGGRDFAAEDERALKLLAASIAPAVGSASEAPGGRDPVSGLPNSASLRRVLRRELDSRVPLTVMAVGLEGFESHDRTYGPSAGDALLEQLGGNLRSAPRGRVFHAGRHELVILLGGNDERRARGYARGLRRLIAQSTSGSAASPAASVGFVAIGPEGEDPDLVLSAAAGALREARRRPERLLGLPAGAGIEAGKGAGASTEKAQAAVRALFEAVRARDPRLAEHSKAVSDVARRIGSGMGLPRDQAEALAAGALLHDVGKIALPDAILQKPGPLTEEEYGVVRQHPVLGAKILGPIGELAAALPVLRHHHERFDGGGYPDGLRGEETPLLARITVAADAFDSMTRDRGYQRGVSAKAALQELVRNAGSQFDPDVVAALVRVVEEPGNLSAGSVG